MPDLYFDLSWDSVENILRRRGLTVVSRGDKSKVVFPLEAIDAPMNREEKLRLRDARQPYYELFGRYSFRKVVRELILADSDGLKCEQLLKISGKRTDRYIRFLTEDMRIARLEDESLVFTRQLNGLGSSIEEYISYLCENELRGRSEWGVKVKGLPTGGDFDVLAWLAPKLIHIECKSGNPKGIDESELRHFLLRHNELGADISILFVDTDGPLDDFVDRLNDVIEPDYRAHDDVKEVYPLRRRGVQFKINYDEMRVRQVEYYPSIWFGYHRVYVINNQPSIITQIRRCLSHHHIYFKQVDLLIAKSFLGT